MAPQFGTSGLRGLVVDLTDDLVANYVTAFIAACPTGGCIHIGQDLRPSSPVIASAVERAVLAAKSYSRRPQRAEVLCPRG